MPVPRDLHGRMIAARFRRRRQVAAGIIMMVAGTLAYVVAILINPPAESPFSTPATSRMAIAGIAICLALLMLYTKYRCPNCNLRPLGKGWLGLNPSRCPSCKSGLK